MNPELFSILMAFISIVILILLIAKLKFNPFLSLLLSALFLGLTTGNGLVASAKAFQTGFGSILGSVGPVVGLGALLGGILLGSGAADRIAEAFIAARPVKWIPTAICAAALLIGMPYLFDVSFIMLVPLVYAAAKRAKVHLLWIGLPLAMGLYVSHGLLPPHPAPMLAVEAFHANTGLTIFYGLLIAIPTAIICGPVFTKLMSPYFGPAPDLNSGPGAVQAEKEKTARPVSLTLALITVLMPPVLMLIGTLGSNSGIDHASPIYTLFVALDNSMISLGCAVIFAIFALGILPGRNFSAVGKMAGKGLAPIGNIILILGAGGGLKGVLSLAHIDQLIVDTATNWAIPPLVLAWTLGALLRICLGSATVATTAAAGIVAPLVATGTVSPELLVLATASGSVMLSHVNDSGFWMFKEYFQLSVGQTFRTWTFALCIQSVIGLIGVLIINAFI